jgi:hypothetical protein
MWPANASSSPSKTMQLHVGLAILFRGLANSSLAIHLLHALLLGLVCNCMTLHVGLAIHLPHSLLSPLPMTHATACRPRHCVCCMAAHRFSMLLKRSALFLVLTDAYPTAFLQCNSHVSRAGASFFLCMLAT